MSDDESRHKGDTTLHKVADTVSNAERSRVMGYVFITIAIVMVVQGAWLQWQRQQETDCQADYNQDVSSVVSQRAVWADEDRNALNKMIFTVIDPKADEAERRAAVEKFADTARRNDKNRKANPMPKRTDC